MKYLKKASIVFAVIAVCFFGVLRSQQLDGFERPQIWERSLRQVTDMN